MQGVWMGLHFDAPRKYQRIKLTLEENSGGDISVRVRTFSLGLYVERCVRRK
jgi:hypothetical protein